MYKLLTALLIVVALVGVSGPSQAQELTWCDAVYAELRDGDLWIWPYPVGCTYHNGTQAIPLREAPAWAVPWPLSEGALVEGEALWPPDDGIHKCAVPTGPTITITDAARIYYAPDSRAATEYVIPAGSTAQAVGTEDGYTQIVWACDTVWVMLR